MKLKKFTFLLAFGLFLVFSTPTFAQQPAPLDIALQHIKESRQKLQLTERDITDYVISDLYSSSHNGVSHIYLNQTYQDIKVRNAILNINILPNGEVLNMGNKFVKDLQAKVNTSTATLTPSQALQIAINHLQIQTDATVQLLERVNDQHFIFEHGGIALEPINVRLQYEVIDDKKVKLSWNVELYQLDAHNWWNLRIDATNGAILSKFDQVIHCNFDHRPSESCLDHVAHNEKHQHQNADNPFLINTYSVFAMPVESPNHGDQTQVTAPADPVASPFGWHDTDGVMGHEYTITRGNNTHAYHDIFNLNNSIGDEPDGGESLDFNFPYDESNNQPFTQIDPAVVNLFYWNNVMHDVWYNYGFDEVSGNFQVNNYGNGGQEGDYVRGETLDGSGTNNANFASGADGSNARIQMYIWTDDNLPNTQTDPPVLTVNEPASVAGEYPMVAAAFGGSLPIEPLIGEVVLVDDGSGNTSDACEDIVNASEVAGKIALIDRGDCQFGTKILRAENSGAIAVIMCNNQNTASFAMTAGDDGDPVTIPAIMMSLQDCNTIKMGLPGMIVQFQQPEYILPTPGPTGFDGDVDNGIIAHEYTHGISIRLTGGPSSGGCLSNFEQAGEGWSDWFGMVMQTTEANNADQGRGIGTYALGEPINGGGIRTHRYSRNMTINPHTYEDINNESVPHGVGSIWAVMIWDLYWNMVDLHGFDDNYYTGTGGNNMTMQLVLDGLKLQPCDPSFFEARDAILAADVANYDGAHQCLIWETFARRGLGANAQSGGINGFELPILCQDILKVIKTAPEEANAGSIITYTLEISNDFPSFLADVTITDSLPVGTQYVEGSASCANTSFENGVLTIEIGDMDTGEGTTCTYQVMIPDSPFSYTTYEDDVENGVADWAVTTDLGAVNWELNSDNTFDGNFAWFAPNIDTETDQLLTFAIPFTLDDISPGLAFWHFYDTEGSWDGGVVEISTNGGDTWEDLGDLMTENGYNGTLNESNTNPLGDRPAFNGNSGEYIRTYIDLTSYAGQDVQFRFRFGSDGAVGGVGWYIDQIQIFGNLHTITNKACISSGSGDPLCGTATTIINEADPNNTTTLSSLVKMNLFPNPAQDKVAVQLEDPHFSPATISLLNVNGQLLYSQKAASANGTFEFDLRTYPAGIYMIQVQTAETNLVQKVVIQ